MADGISLATRWSKWPRLLVTALIVGVGISQVILAIGDWHLRDMGAYWEAAMRLRDGEPLYPALADSEASEVYRYAPWLAWTFVPLTSLPRELVNVLWSGTLLAASAAALWPLARGGHWLLVAFFGSVLIGISAIGNIHPLLIAALVHGVERRSGPLWVGVAASLKIFPILLALVYAGRRQWGRFAASLAIGGVLWAPALLYDLGAYATDPGSAGMLFTIPWAYAVALAAGIGATWVLAPGRFGWLAAAATLCIALPRFFVYDVTYLMVGAPAGLPAAKVDDRAG